MEYLSRQRYDEISAELKHLIDEVYPKVKDAWRPDDPLPEIFTRLAGIRTEQGDTEEALRLYDIARNFLS